MKANELMIGDYVMVAPSKMPIKIAAVHHKKVAYHACTSRFEWVRMSLLEPIPLTKEILEKNGLVFDCDTGLFEEDTNYRLEISIENGNIHWSINYDEYHILRLKYVHELQHALKLCGIDKEIELCHNTTTT